MEEYLANYRVIIEPDEETGTGKPGFTAYVPKLGIADSGYTVEEALKNIRSLIKFHIESLILENELIPASDSEESFVTNTKIKFSTKQTRKIKFLLF